MRKLRGGWRAAVLLSIAVFMVSFVVLQTVSPATAAQLDLKAKAGILIDGASGQVLYENNADEGLPPASVTKIMTLVLALEALRDERISLDDLVTTSENARSMGGTQIWLEVGEQMPVKEVLYAIAVGSANDAAVALAETMAGSEAAFVEMMNDRAKELGMTNTHFVNPTGLPPSSVGKAGENHVMSARDIAIVSRYAMQFPLFRDLVSTWGPVVMRPNTSKKPVLWNYNDMLKRYPYQGLNGIKTGMTQAAGFCISASAARDNLELIAVVLGASTSEERRRDVRTLLNYGYSNYKAIPIVSTGDIVAEATIRKGAVEKVSVVVQKDVAITVERGSKAEPIKSIVWNPNRVAPVAKGEKLGELVIQLDGGEQARVDLVADAAVERGTVVQLILRTARRIFRGISGR